MYAVSRAVLRVLSHADENFKDHPMHFAIRALSAPQSNYLAFEKDALGVIVALKKFEHYLTSNRSKLYTDHQALKYVLNMKDCHRRIALWVTLLAEYDFEICFRAGHDNACANVLYRLVEYMVIEEKQRF